ncbi:MAG: DUF1508 domain-containing protein [Halolamina sp.]
MATEQSSDSTLRETYRTRIGEPHTDDEVTGYWLFVLGLVLGFLSILLFLGSSPRGGMREAAIVFGGLGLILLLVGPTLRLPLRDTATRAVYAGAAIAAVGVLYFVTVFPDSWPVATGDATVITLYALGIGIIGVGAVLVPLLSRTSEEEVSALRRELLEMGETLEDTAADEADLAEVVADLRAALADTQADEADLAALVDELRRESADVQADEADLAAQLRSLRDSQARFELYEDNSGEHRFRLRHRNGNIIATSGEGYTRRHNAQKGMESVRRNALGASVLRIEAEEELAEEGEAFEPPAETESQTTFELYEDTDGDYRWRLRHDNDNIVADSGQGYTRKRDAQQAIDRVQEYAGPGEYLRVDPVGFEIYRDADGKWRWRLLHRNGNILADGGQGYSRRRDARRAVDRIREDIDDLEFEQYEDDAGDYRWRLTSPNGQIVADSGEGYASEAGVEDAIERVTEYAPEADALDIGWAAFEVFEDASGDYRWRLRHRNGNIMADGGQGYAEKSGAEDAVDSFKLNAPGAEMEPAEDAEAAGDTADDE